MTETSAGEYAAERGASEGNKTAALVPMHS